MQQLERFQPEYIRIMMERLEGRISTVDMDQRNTAHGLMEAGHSITNWENFLRREIREVAEDVSNLQEIVADRSGPIPPAERNINIRNEPANDNPQDIPWYAEETMGNSTLMQDSFIQEARGVEAQPRSINCSLDAKQRGTPYCGERLSSPQDVAEPNPGPLIDKKRENLTDRRLRRSARFVVMMKTLPVVVVVQILRVWAPMVMMLIDHVRAEKKMTTPMMIVVRLIDVAFLNSLLLVEPTKTDENPS